MAPETYDDSRRITDFLRSNRAVVLSTLDVDPGLARRLVDFTAGTAYALNAKIEMLIRGVYLISPQGMFVGPEMKERLRAANYHALDPGMRFVHDLITLYIWILIIMMVLSWFPAQNSQGGLAITKRILADITEPVLRPLRAILPRPRVGGIGFDFAPFVAVIILAVINSYI